MKRRRLFILGCLPMLILMLIAVVYKMNWLLNGAELITYIILLIGFYKKLNFSNNNFIAFMAFSIACLFLNLLKNENVLVYLSMSCHIGAYFFLAREALKFTQRETGNKFMRLFFFLMITANIYFVFDHFEEIGSKIGGVQEYWFYLIYYFVLMVLAIVGLIYYLNSYSRKSVFFVVLLMTIIVSDILRDMAIFYLPDTSVLILQTFLQFVGIILVFQFYATREKKLRLINLL